RRSSDRKEAVLLGLVEPMDLVDEESRLPAAGGEALPRLSHDFPDPGHSLGDGTERHEDPSGSPGDDRGQRCLAAARRAPENDGTRRAPLDRFPQWLPRPEDMLLPGILVERARTHS